MTPRSFAVDTMSTAEDDVVVARGSWETRQETTCIYHHNRHSLDGAAHTYAADRDLLTYLFIYLLTYLLT